MTLLEISQILFFFSGSLFFILLAILLFVSIYVFLAFKKLVFRKLDALNFLSRFFGNRK